MGDRSLKYAGPLAGRVGLSRRPADKAGIAMLFCPRKPLTSDRRLLRDIEKTDDKPHLPIRPSQVSQGLLKMLHLHLRPATNGSVDQDITRPSFREGMALTARVPPCISRSLVEYLVRADPGSYTLAAAPGQLPRTAVGRAEPATSGSAYATTTMKIWLIGTQQPR